MNVEEGRAAPLVERVNDAIRENPLAAGLIGAGLAWMLFGSKGLGAVGSLAKSAGSTVASAATDLGSATVTAGSTALKAGSATASAAKDAAFKIMDTAGSIVPEQLSLGPSGAANTLKDARDALGAGVQSMNSSGRDYTVAIQSRLSDTLDKQPLLLGAIGLAIGAGIASTFATTDVESEWMGERGTAVRENLKNLTDEAKERAREVVSEVKTEATRQGLTVDAAKEAAATIGTKSRNVVESAHDSIATHLGSSVPQTSP